jgi:hypothetical protein
MDYQEAKGRCTYSTYTRNREMNRKSTKQLFWRDCRSGTVHTAYTISIGMYCTHVVFSKDAASAASTTVGEQTKWLAIRLIRT